MKPISILKLNLTLTLSLGILRAAIQQRPQCKAYDVICIMDEALMKDFQQSNIERFLMPRPVASAEEI
jgi:hypothetical protein